MKIEDGVYHYRYIADMGCIKILSKHMSAFFLNGVGDGEFDVYVYDNKKNIPNETEFVGHFTVYEEAWLMKMDCSNDSRIHRFGLGRFFVYLDNDNQGTFYIAKEDEDIHA